MKVFIVHARRTGYGVIRSLIQENAEFYIADDVPTPLFKSKYVKQAFLLPDITSTLEDDFVEKLVSLAQRMSYEKEKPIVFTGKDDYLVFFAKHWKILQEYFLLSFETDIEILNRALSKQFLPEIAEAADVMVPKTFLNLELDDDSITLNYPLVVKPFIKNSPKLDVVSAAFRIAICDSYNDLIKATQTLQELKVGYVIQEYISGLDSELYTMATYSYEGELRAWSSSRKIRQFPPHVGECSFGQTIYLPELVEPAQRLLKELRLTGISQIEFKHYNNKYYLIEINPRVWSWHQIHSKVGVNFCAIAALTVLRKSNQELVSPLPKTAYWIFLMMDYLHNVKLNKNISWTMLFIDFLKSDVEAFLFFRDPKVFLMHLRETLAYFKTFEK